MEKKKLTAENVSFCGMAAALSVTVLFLSSLIPLLTYTAPVFVSLILVPVKKRCGISGALCTYLAVSLLVLILGADKEAAFFYIFYGHYPVIKEYADRIKPKALRLCAKILLFSLLTFLMYYLLLQILGIGEAVSGRLWADMLFYVLLITVMMLYDRLLDRVPYMKIVKYLTGDNNGKYRRQ